MLERYTAVIGADAADGHTRRYRLAGAEYPSKTPDVDVDAAVRALGIAVGTVRGHAAGPDQMLAVALHKGNVSWELSGWAPKYFPDALKRDIKSRLRDKIMFGSDYPSISYERIFKEWQELGYSDELMEKIYHRNAERILGL